MKCQKLGCPGESNCSTLRSFTAFYTKRYVHLFLQAAANQPFCRYLWRIEVSNYRIYQDLSVEILILPIANSGHWPGKKPQFLLVCGDKFDCISHMLQLYSVNTYTKTLCPRGRVLENVWENLHQNTTVADLWREAVPGSCSTQTAIEAVGALLSQCASFLVFASSLLGTLCSDYPYNRLVWIIFWSKLNGLLKRSIISLNNCYRNIACPTLDQECLCCASVVTAKLNSCNLVASFDKCHRGSAPTWFAIAAAANVIDEPFTTRNLYSCWRSP